MFRCVKRPLHRLRGGLQVGICEICKACKCWCRMHRRGRHLCVGQQRAEVTRLEIPLVEERRTLASVLLS